MSGSSMLGRKIVLGVVAVIALAPIVFLVLTSLRPAGEFLATPPTLLPSAITFDHYVAAFQRGDAGSYFINSLLIASFTTIISLVAGTLAGYGLARMGMSAKVLGIVVFIFIAIRFYPRITTVIPWFLFMRELNLLDTVWGIILGHIGITTPFVAWLMLTVFRDAPRDLEDSARVDGCSPLQRLWYVLVPINKPALAAAAIFTAFMSWNEFLIATSIARRQATTLSIAVASFITDRGIDWGPMSAMGFVIVLPMVLVALLLTRYLVRGLALGAVKE